MLNAQNCGTNTPLPEQQNMVLEGCVDPTGPLPDFNGDLEFHIQLVALRDANGNNGVTQAQLEQITVDLNEFYNDPTNSGIPNQKTFHFNVSYAEWRSDDLMNDNLITLEDILFRYPNCFTGVILPENYEQLIGQGFNDQGGLGSGHFMARISPNSRIIQHEMGHALGLLHTFQGSTGINERARRQNSTEDDCDCNCLISGDFICDTPADPGYNTPNSNGLPASVAGDCTYNYIQDYFDDCGDKVELTDGVIESNVMSYTVQKSCDVTLTAGQIRFIRSRVNSSPRLQRAITTPPDPFEMISSIESPTTWDSNMEFNNDVYVNSDLTINNAIIQFTPGHGLIVAPNVTLDIRASTLRDYIGTTCYASDVTTRFWSGIKIVDGNSSDQNSIIIANSSSIINAKYGLISTGQQVINGAIHYTNFINTDVALDISNPICNAWAEGIDVSYTNPEYFELLEGGIEDTDYIINLNTDKFVIRGNSVIDGNNTNKEFAIISNNVNLRVENSEIKEVVKGIEYTSSTPTGCSVRTTEFSKVTQGINLNNPLGSNLITKCDFIITETLLSTTTRHAVRSTNLTDFEFSENTVNATGATELIEGFSINSNLSSSDIYNLVKGNNLVATNKSIRSSGDHGDGITGITFLCNEFDATNWDLEAKDDIAKYQAFMEPDGLEINFFSAGNKFNYTPFGGTTVFDDWFYQGITPVDPPLIADYYHNPANANEEPLNRTTTIFTIPTSNDKCDEIPQPTPPIIITDRVKDKLMDLQSDEDDILDAFDTVLDGGNTTSVINVIQTTSSTNPDYVLTVIENNEPFLSIPAATVLLDNSDYFTEAQITDVLVSNPQVVYDDYIQYLVFQSNSFSQANTYSIQQAMQSDNSARKTLEAKLSHIRSEIHKEIRYLLTYWETNDLDYTFQSDVYAYYDDFINNTKAIELQLVQGNTSQAQIMLVGLDKYRGYSDSRDQEINKYVELKQLEIDLINNNQSWSDISQTQRAVLFNIADNAYGLASALANNIRYINFGLDLNLLSFDDDYTPITFKQFSTRSSENESNVTVSDLSKLRESWSSDKNYIIQIYGIDGRLVVEKSLSSVRNDDISSSDGIYIYRVSEGNNLIQSGKLIHINGK